MNKNDWKYSTEKLFENVNVFFINYLYLKTINLYLKKHNLLFLINN